MRRTAQIYPTPTNNDKPWFSWWELAVIKSRLPKLLTTQRPLGITYVDYYPAMEAYVESLTGEELVALNRTHFPEEYI